VLLTKVGEAELKRREEQPKRTFGCGYQIPEGEDPDLTVLLQQAEEATSLRDVNSDKAAFCEGKGWVTITDELPPDQPRRLPRNFQSEQLVLTEKGRPVLFLHRQPAAGSRRIHGRHEEYAKEVGPQEHQGTR
jgi:hypothetical protein